MAEAPPRTLAGDLSPRTFWIGAALLFLAGLALRLRGLGRELEYDEIWTLQHYAKAVRVSLIFEELSNTNNHTWHSLLMRGALALGGEREWVLRLPAFLPGLGVLALTPWLARRLGATRGLTLLVLAAVAGNAYLIHYGQTARGYSLQAFLLVLLAAAACWAGETSEWRAGLGVLGLAVLPGLAFSLMPSSAFYLPVLGTLHLAGWARAARQRGQALDRVRLATLLGAWGLGALLCALWLAHARQGYTVGTHIFGTRADLATTGAFAGSQMLSLYGWLWWLGLALAVLWPAARFPWGLLGWTLLLVPLGLSALLAVLPARVYTPGVPLVGLGVAGGLGAILALLPRASWRAWGLGLLAALLAGAWALPGPGRLAALGELPWAATFGQLRQQLPADAWPLFPAPAGIHLRYYLGSTAGAAFAVPAGAECWLALVNDTGRLEGVRASDGQADGLDLPPLPLATGNCGAPVRLLPLQRLAAAPDAAPDEPLPAGFYAAFAGPLPLPQLAALRRQLLGAAGPRGYWLEMNALQAAVWRDPASGQPCSSLALMALNPGLTTAQARALEAGGALRLYRGEALWPAARRLPAGFAAPAGQP